jgi:BrnA antitoxin of type II toxin-antitoxin system
MKKTNKENYMKKATRRAKSKNVTMIVTKKDYDRAISSGIGPDEVLRPGTYPGRRGGFLERHKEDMASGRIETKSGTYVKLDRDILRFFKAKAPRRSVAPDQTQINEALRAFIRRARNGS